MIGRMPMAEAARRDAGVSMTLQARKITPPPPGRPAGLRQRRRPRRANADYARIFDFESIFVVAAKIAALAQFSSFDAALRAKKKKVAASMHDADDELYLR